MASTAIATLSPPPPRRGHLLTDKTRVIVRHIKPKRCIRIDQEVDARIMTYCTLNGVRYSAFMERAASFVLRSGKGVAPQPTQATSAIYLAPPSPASVRQEGTQATRGMHGISMEQALDQEIVAYCRSRQMTYSGFLEHAARQFLHTSSPAREEAPATSAGTR